MKLQIILRDKINKNKGFLSFEIMIAVSLFILFTISVFSLDSSMQGIKGWSLKELDLQKISANNMNDNINNAGLINDSSLELYGNYSKVIRNELFNITKSDFIEGWGSSSCSNRILFDSSNISYFDIGVFLGLGNKSTDIQVRNSVVYLTADSSIQSQSDFFIIDSNDYINPKIISEINTGPGLASLAIAGPYAYVANISSISQLQIIDIHNRSSPYIISQLKIALPEASSTPPKGNSIFYSNGFIYLGTNKWDGEEFHIIDVSDPVNPRIIGSFETNTLINDIFVYKDIAYLATSDEYQMRILDISNKNNIILMNTFSPSGWQVQQGKAIEYFENALGLGRTVGGVNKVMNHEAFIFSTSSNNTVNFSKDIPGGVYGLLIRKPFIFLITHLLNEGFQVWDFNLSSRIFYKSLNSMPSSMSCDRSSIFFSTNNEKGFSILKL